MSRRPNNTPSGREEEKAIRTSFDRDRYGHVNTSTRLSTETSSPPRHRSNLDRLNIDISSHDRGTRSISRDRSRSRSPYRKGRSTSRSRSPSRSGLRPPKSVSGEKRRREEDHYTSKGASDPRRFKVHYEGGFSKPDHATRHRDLRADADDRMSRAYKTTRGRDRSRSPYKHNEADRKSETGGRPRSREMKENVDVNSTRETTISTTDQEANNATSDHDDPYDTNNNAFSRSVVGGQESQVFEESKLSESELIDQRRRRREAIKAKHKSQAPLLVQALEQNIASAPATPLNDSSGITSEQQSPPSSLDSPVTPKLDSPVPGSPGSPASFMVSNDEELANHAHTEHMTNDDEGPSAADYDPNMDMQEDRPEHKRKDPTGSADGTHPQPDDDQGEGAAQAPKEYDMFAEADDDDDMFAPEDTKQKPSVSTTKARALDESLLDNWDYPDGHYRIMLGELLDGRYAVQQQIGKGTFATVVRAQDTKSGSIVAVKIACNNDTMYKAGTREMDFVQLLNEQDMDDKKHIIRLLRRFDHKGHMCLVFENLSADLREVLKKFGRNVGINLKAIRSYAQQMFLALSHMKKCQILHADLKPDNMLVSERRNLLKICDLGTAAFVNDAEITPYLVSRFYRAPEVILGMPFDYAIDMWSVGCTLFELYTGRILFPGSDNNQMLRTIQECRGRIPNRMLKRSEMIDKHYTADGTFVSQERDKITGKTTMRQMIFAKTTPGKDIKARLTANSKGMAPSDLKELYSFVDLMDKCLRLDPAQRISANEALRHPFIMHSIANTTTEGKSAKVTPAMSISRFR